MNFNKMSEHGNIYSTYNYNQIYFLNFNILHYFGSWEQLISGKVEY